MTRYIDADALIGALHNHAFLEGDDRSICYNIIQKQPTVDAVPVKRGQWIPTCEFHGFDNEVRNKALSCSVCKVAFRISDYAMIEDFRYCPNCGARMDAERKEE